MKMKVRNYYTFCVEFFKTQNNHKPTFLRYVFQLRLMNRPPKYKMTLRKKCPNADFLLLHIYPYVD